MDWVPLILSIIGGAAGGNLIPTIIKNLNLSPALRSIIGAIGGGLGGSFAAGAVGVEPGAGLDLQAILATLGGGLGGGGIVTAIVGLIKNAMSK